MVLVQTGSSVFPASSRTTRSNPRILSGADVSDGRARPLRQEEAGLLPVTVVDLCRDLLLQLHEVVFGQRSRHDLGAVLDEAVGHLLHAPEQRGFIRLSR